MDHNQYTECVLFVVSYAFRGNYYRIYP